MQHRSICSYILLLSHVNGATSDPESLMTSFLVTSSKVWVCAWYKNGGLQQLHLTAVYFSPLQPERKNVTHAKKQNIYRYYDVTLEISGTASSNSRKRYFYCFGKFLWPPFRLYYFAGKIFFPFISIFPLDFIILFETDFFHSNSIFSFCDCNRHYALPIKLKSPEIHNLKPLCLELSKVDIAKKQICWSNSWQVSGLTWGELAAAAAALCAASASALAPDWLAFSEL